MPVISAVVWRPLCVDRRGGEYYMSAPTKTRTNTRPSRHEFDEYDEPAVALAPATLLKEHGRPIEMDESRYVDEDENPFSRAY
jgi:hypothetical protein